MARRSKLGSRTLFAATSSLLLAGCSGVGPERAILGGGVNPAGVNHLIDFKPQPIGSDDLARVICPTVETLVTDKKKVTPNDDLFVLALGCFQAASKVAGAADEMQWRRNDAQFFLIMRSDQNCGLWMTYLERAGAINRGSFNILSVLTGGAGAIVNGQAASILAGVSSASSGTGAAIDAAMLHGMTEALIFPRVIAKRTELRTAIEGHQEEPLTKYSLMRALSDAVTYHAACNVSTAFSENDADAQANAFLRVMTTVQHVQLQARPAAPSASKADILPNAVFLMTGNQVAIVTKYDGKSSPPSVTYTISGATAPVTEDVDAFAKKLDGAVVLRAGK